MWIQNHRKRILQVLAVAVFVAFLLFLQPRFHYQFLGHDQHHKYDISLGLTSSPWLTYHAEQRANQPKLTEFRLIMRSWSWLFLVLGAILWRLQMLLKRGDQHSPATPVNTSDIP